MKLFGKEKSHAVAHAHAKTCPDCGCLLNNPAWKNCPRCLREIEQGCGCQGCGACKH